ncbi:hypothetical protein C4D60_Mb06t09340 [Musa balbisiana]|uniref:Uncharacterized protein n=1 Tax=Musa balbisiana TaxID=52838 RepID=A0A4V4H3S6_MUSBA|nr:hypothetical protein C4D60_Mb06t09340 [Musa balbisiana]
MGSFILAEKIYLGGIIGAVLIVVGLYSVLWGKHKENKEKTTEADIPVSIKGTQGDGQVMEIIELDEVELEKAKSGNKVIDFADVAIIPDSSDDSPKLEQIIHDQFKKKQRVDVVQHSIQILLKNKKRTN